MKRGVWIGLVLILVLSLAWGLVPANAFVFSMTLPPTGRIAPEVRQAIQNLSSGARLRVIVTLASKTSASALADSLRFHSAGQRQELLERSLQADADQVQSGLRPRLTQLQASGEIGDLQSFWIFNGFSMSASASVINELAAWPEVLSIQSDRIFQGEAVNGSLLTPLSAPTTNIALINAPALWALGFTGQGIVVANLDTGVDGTHPDLSASYRGGSNSWFDPYGQHATPTDLAGVSTGHGTATMSMMVAGNAGGSDLGAAPGAQWIAAKIFDDSGNASVSAIHLAFQWLLNPSGDPAVHDAPQVVNGSWGTTNPGCDPTFQADLQALRAAGILPVFSAGNSGPSGGTGSSPANLPEAFSVGAINNSSLIASFSSRGPNTCPAAPISTFPLLVAPGFNVPVAAPNGMYNTLSGTSFSAPQVSGVAALLLSAFPGTQPDLLSSALVNGSVPLGAPSPNNDYGYGRVDALGAYHYLLAGSAAVTPTFTRTATSTATSTPTLTITPIPTLTKTPTSVFTSTPTSITFPTKASATRTVTPPASDNRPVHIYFPVVKD